MGVEQSNPRRQFEIAVATTAFARADNSESKSRKYLAPHFAVHQAE
jgi:hypothetical protein